MILYSKFAPTGFDIKGLSLPDRQDWLVAPCSVNRDSSVLEQSNWSVQAEIAQDADPTYTDHESHSFNHWACGWFEILLVRPGSPAADALDKLEAALSDYPVADDADYSSAQWDEAARIWQNARESERRDYCSKAHISRRKSRNKRMPPEVGDILVDTIT